MPRVGLARVGVQPLRRARPPRPKAAETCRVPGWLWADCSSRAANKMRFREGKLVLLRGLWNPMVVIEATSGAYDGKVAS
ncbi:hypothetical protein [Micromonospora chersina]|uniref:hypothetical protein n=1 Tax=Micromonospora chersina TaxID=47854 RepID=UPI003D8ED64C